MIPDLLLTSVLYHPAVIGLIVGGPSATLGYLGYRQSRRVDGVAEQAGIATVQAGTIKQVIDGLNTLVEALQTDNRSLRDTVSAMESRLAAVVRECNEVRAELAVLRASL